jgi:hypothetical protein
MQTHHNTPVNLIRDDGRVALFSLPEYDLNGLILAQGTGGYIQVRKRLKFKIAQ